MIIIAHKGNINGPNPAKENSPEYLLQALGLGYHVEVDVRWDGSRYLTGHDKGQYEVSTSFLRGRDLRERTKSKVWCHAKDIMTLNQLIEDDCHCFFHQNDDVALTSQKFLWTYPGKDLTPFSIAVMPETANPIGTTIDPSLPPFAVDRVYGICTDYAFYYGGFYINLNE